MSRGARGIRQGMHAAWKQCERRTSGSPAPGRTAAQRRGCPPAEARQVGARALSATAARACSPGGGLPRERGRLCDTCCWQQQARPPANAQDLPLPPASVVASKVTTISAFMACNQKTKASGLCCTFVACIQVAHAQPGPASACHLDARAGWAGCARTSRHVRFDQHSSRHAGGMKWLAMARAQLRTHRQRVVCVAAQRAALVCVWAGRQTGGQLKADRCWPTTASGCCQVLRGASAAMDAA